MTDEQRPSPLSLRERMHHWATRMAGLGRDLGEIALEFAFFWRR